MRWYRFELIAACQDEVSECWTVVIVDNIDVAMAKRKIHSTNRFFKISDLIAATGSDYADFHDRLVALTGVPSASRGFVVRAVDPNRYH